MLTDVMTVQSLPSRAPKMTRTLNPPTYLSRHILRSGGRSEFSAPERVAEHSVGLRLVDNVELGRNKAALQSLLEGDLRKVSWTRTLEGIYFLDLRKDGEHYHVIKH